MVLVYVWFSHEQCQFPNYLLVFNLGILEYNIEILGENTGPWMNPLKYIWGSFLVTNHNFISFCFLGLVIMSNLYTQNKKIIHHSYVSEMINMAHYNSIKNKYLLVAINWIKARHRYIFFMLIPHYDFHSVNNHFLLLQIIEWIGEIYTIRGTCIRQ